jgi:hypothetical protein
MPDESTFLKGFSKVWRWGWILAEGIFAAEMIGMAYANTLYPQSGRLVPDVFSGKYTILCSGANQKK